MTPWTAARQASLSIARSKLPEFTQTHVHCYSHPTISSSVIPFSSCPQSFPASRSFLIRWLKYWSFSFSISPSNEYSGSISFRIDWFDLLAVRGTLKSLLQHYNLKASILWHSVFLMVQLSHLYTYWVWVWVIFRVSQLLVMHSHRREPSLSSLLLLLTDSPLCWIQAPP